MEDVPNQPLHREGEKGLCQADQGKDKAQAEQDDEAEKEEGEGAGNTEYDPLRWRAGRFSPGKEQLSQPHALASDGLARAI